MQHLNSSQYRRANRVMGMILVVSYLVYIIVEVMNAKGNLTSPTLMRCVAYGVSALISLVLATFFPHKKRTSYLIAAPYLVIFPIMIFGNGIVVLAMVFPVVIGFMVYLNVVPVAVGWVYVLIVGVIKVLSVKGDSVLFNYGILLLAGYGLAALGSISVMLLLSRFSKEDQAVIQEAAEHQRKVAEAVATISGHLYTDFTDMVRGLDTVRTAMHSADEAMDGIAASSNDTSNAVNNQAAMTTQIQSHLEHTTDLAAKAENATVALNDVVARGGRGSDRLMEQSAIVDQNVKLVSNVMKQLLENVEDVKGITGAITKISSQTNLLALNASVEAARAGTAGRGFSVIAGEIRSMSAETEESTDKIEAIIAQLTSLTDQIQSAVVEAAQSIAHQREQVLDVNLSLHEIEDGIFLLRKDIETMNADVHNVLNANGEIVESIGLLSAASEETSSGMEVCKQTTDTAFENLNRFSKKVDNAFEELRVLKETAGA